MGHREEGTWQLRTYKYQGQDTAKVMGLSLHPGPREPRAGRETPALCPVWFVYGCAHRTLAYSRCSEQYLLNDYVVAMKLRPLCSRNLFQNRPGFCHLRVWPWASPWPCLSLAGFCDPGVRVARALSCREGNVCKGGTVLATW